VLLAAILFSGLESKQVPCQLFLIDACARRSGAYAWNTGGELPYEISKRTDFRSAESELSNYGNGALGQLRCQRSELSRGSGNSAPGSSALNVFIVRPANWQQSTRIQNAFIRVPSRAMRQYRSTRFHPFRHREWMRLADWDLRFGCQQQIKGAESTVPTGRHRLR